ncbi:hypothetical protein HZS_2953 [Henneguya salminicola]|nr:hypothetical protein HZS_2953 [Henneguya salminicola]
MSFELRANLQKVQNLIKRDPESYGSEFKLYFVHFKKVYDVQKHNASSRNDELVILINFIGSVIRKFSKSIEEFVKLLFEMITLYGMEMEVDIRLEACKMLCKFRGNKIIGAEQLMEAFIDLMDCKDKSLRINLFKMIVSDLKIGSQKSHFTQVTKNKLQTFFYKRLSDNSYSLNIQYACLCILCEMWRRNTWQDLKIANAIANASLSCHHRVSYRSLITMKGFISKIKELDVENSDDEYQEAADMINKNAKRSRVHGTSRSKKKNKRHIQKTIRAMKKAEQKRSSTETIDGNTSIIRLLYNPQDFCEKMFVHVTNKNNKIEYRFLGLEVLSRVIAVHALIFPPIYEYCIKFLLPHQTGVIKILTCLATASHQLVPPEYIKPIVESICNNFVSLQNAAEVCSVGINSIREIYTRAPLAVDKIIARDLILYARDRKAEPAVVSAARSLLQLLRVVNPTVLAKRDQLGNSKNVSLPPYGSVVIHESVPGIDLQETDNEDSYMDVSNTDLNTSDSESALIDSEMCTTDILDDEDFKRLRMLNKKSLGSNPSDSDSDIEKLGDSLTSTNAIGTVYKLKKSKLERQSDYSHKVNPHKGWRFDAKASSTNREKRKNKPFMMIKHKNDVKNKKSRSFKQRVTCLKKALEKKRHLKI